MQGWESRAAGSERNCYDDELSGVEERVLRKVAKRGKSDMLIWEERNKKLLNPSLFVQYEVNQFSAHITFDK